MLSERLYCFLGRTKGFEGLREWLLIGEPLRTLLVPLKLANWAFCRAPAIGGQGLLAD